MRHRCRGDTDWEVTHFGNHKKLKAKKNEEYRLKTYSGHHTLSQHSTQNTPRAYVGKLTCFFFYIPFLLLSSSLYCKTFFLRSRFFALPLFCAPAFNIFLKNAKFKKKDVSPSILNFPILKITIREPLLPTCFLKT